MKKILIAIPTAKYIEPATFKSIYNLYIPEGYEVHFEFFYGYNIAQIRNLIAHFTIVNDYDYLLAVDSDMVLPGDTLVKLLNVDADVVTGVYRQRNIEYNIPEIYIHNNNGGVENIDIMKLNDSSDVIDIAACGFGCVLINKNILTTIGYPQFVYKDAILMEDTVSEDVYFCNKVLEHSGSIKCVTSLRCGHIGEFELHT